MFFKLFLAFTLVPAIEIYLLITIGRFIGPLNTVLVIIVTGVTGAYFARLEGMHTMFKVQSNLNQGVIPTEELVDAVIILTAGLLLLTPGFLTDLIGFLLLIPGLRFYFKRWLRHKFDQWVDHQHFHIQHFPGGDGRL